MKAILKKATCLLKIQYLSDASKQRAWVQRLGFVLDHIDCMADEKRLVLLDVLEGYLAKRELVYVPLSPKNSTRGAARNIRWMVIENTVIDSDL